MTTPDLSASTPAPLSVVVIGASRGIGAAIATTFASKGHAVIGTHRGSGVPEGVAGFELDITDSAQLDAVVKHAIAENGSLDVIVVSSGITRDNPLVRMSEDDIRAVIDTNLIGPMLASKAAVSKMKRGGSIVLLSSVSARVGHIGQANYTAAKAGLEGFVRTFAQEYGKKVRINIVSPGPTATDMYADASEEAQKLMSDGTPMKRVGQPQEIADVVYWVSQSTYMTGATVPVSGGIVI